MEEEKVMELKDTVEMMNSEDYKERFKAEYYQLKNRYEKLATFSLKYRSGKLEFTPDCSYELLDKQLQAMSRYIRCLEERAEIEDVKL